MRIRPNLAIVVLLAIGFVPFINQAYHIDDTNFLALAAHAWPHPLRLYEFSINWLGVPQRAFDILANPPFVPWYLRLVGTFGTREWIFHLSFFPFVVLATLGLYRLGTRFAGEGMWTVLYCVSTPVFLVSGHTIMPDLPLLACFTFGLSLCIEGMDCGSERRAFVGGLIAGIGALCRYSGICVVPLIVAYGLLYRKSFRSCLGAAAAAVVPFAIWSDLSWWVYGQVHWLALRDFESSAVTLVDLKYKFAYQVASIGLTVGCAALIALVLSRAVSKWACVLVLPATALAVHIAGIVQLKTSSAALLSISFAGTACVVATVFESLRDAFDPGLDNSHRFDGLFLALWAAGTVGFNFTLRFASVRYLILALAPIVLLLQKQMLRRRSVKRQWAVPAVAMAMALSICLSYADAELAGAYRTYAQSLRADSTQRWFVGHWGWQYYLENSGARPLSKYDGRLLGANHHIVAASYPWPQELPPRLKIAAQSQEAVRSGLPLRTCSSGAEACLYIAWLAPGPRRVVLPFGFSDEPVEVFTRIQLR